MSRQLSHSVILFALLVVLAGCDNTIEPIVDDIDGYAVYGYLDMRTDRQVVRVEALRPTLLSLNDDLVRDVTVTTTDLTSGHHIVWSDSSTVDDEGTPITLFTADFRPLEGHEYKLSISGSEGTVLEASTTIPSAPVFYRDELTGTVDDFAQPAFLQGLTSAPQQLRVEYTLININEEVPVTIPVSYGNQGFEANGGWTFSVNYHSDQYVVMRELGRDLGEPGIRFKKIALSFAVSSSEWQQTPGSNIANGHGFFGSVAHYRYDWRLDARGVELLGWINEQQGE